MARPTTIASLEKLGFKVIAYDADRYHARVEFEGARTAMKGGSAKELLAIARGWLAHVSQ